ncbi:protein PYRICULARIA ORYZAE RESISTANCE 21-like [Pistacia vera]|uniref:protein PYRICULARIA ORYZAE RESISTANCE 21-like n=1 Tax=Pistacia vera TaxID=55513 RepID=UPI001263153D|nr:protein PYRICULARIA ORYZAE RESISTANCE 21-like [Pistacia vera]
MAEGTKMVIKVDLNCSKCYKKVKKILCKIPQIQDQVYDEKQNTVTIKVVCCCSPEKIMQKIRCKGGKSIKSIEIKPPEEKKKEKPPANPCSGRKDKPKPCDGKKEDGDKPKPCGGKQKDGDAPKPCDGNQKDGDKPKPCEPPTEVVVIKLPQTPPTKIPVLGCPPAYGYPIPCGVCCRECSEGRKGGPCQHLSCGRPPCYGDYCGKPVCDSWGSGCDCGCNRVYYCRNRGGYYYYCEENPPPCSIM